MRSIHLTLLAALMAVICLAGPSSNAKDRDKIPEQEKWNLTDLYPDEEAWSAAKEELANRIPEVAAYKGKLGDSAGELLNCMNLVFELRKKFSRLASYAGKISDLDLRNSKAMGLKQSLAPLGAEFGARLSWIDPEILSIPEDKIEGFYKEEPGLEIYRPVIDDTLRMKPYTLSPDEEKIMADAGLITGNAQSAFSIFSNADIPRATVTLSDGEEVYLDAAAYTFYRGVQNRWDREQVFQAFFGNLNGFRGLYGTLLNGEVKKNLFRAKARGYENCLASALNGSNVPVEVYKNLIRNVRSNLPTLWRYLKLRKRMMGLEQLRYSDLYASIIKDVDISYTVEEAKKLVLAGVAPLGSDYVEVLGNGLDNRWIDWHPTPGKRSGAYSSGSAYGVHPYVLLNFTGTYEEVSTLAHEVGHAMHSYYSNQIQPYPSCGYTIFVAEVASTCNEHLLMNYMLENTQDDAVKLFLLGSYIDGIRQTLFRQTQFAEFEMTIHEMVEEGEALTGDKLNEVYAGIINDYYGVKEGITEINPICYVEWAYIPHFYYNFYVYSYSTSITASTAISQRILEGKPGAVEDYRRFLTLGGSMPPVEELKVAGVDMTSDEPFTVTMRAMNKAMDKMEDILDRMEGR